MWKVLVYDIEADKAKYRNFNSQAEADHYAGELKKAAFNVHRNDLPAVFIDAYPV